MVIENILKKHLQPAEDYLYGFADLTGLTGHRLSEFSFGISIAKRLEKDVIDNISDGPTPEYYNHYREINEHLSGLSLKILADLRVAGVEATAIEPTLSSETIDKIYLKTLKTDLSHKMVATRAGLGWIGKTGLLVSGKFGPRLRLVSILLKHRVKSLARPLTKSLCGTCNICVDACPAHAANGKLWNINVSREDFYDAWRCRAKCVEFGEERIGNNARVCGICVAVCPFGR